MNKITVCLIILLTCAFQSCLCDKGKIEFSGQIVEPNGKGVSALVKINSVKGTEVQKYEFKSDEKGYFSAKEIREGEKYVLNVEKEGFAFVSKVFTASTTKIKISLAAATVVTVNANQPIFVVDKKLNCVEGVDSSKINFANTQARFPFVYNADGQLIDFRLPKDVETSYKIVQNGVCSSGTIVSIPANSLVNTSGKRVQGDIQISVSTINLLSPDGMPGDFTVRLPEGKSTAYMVSTGAASVDLSQKGEPLQLDGKATATISIPVDSTVLMNGLKLTETIPFLVYDKEKGEWYQDGTASLNKEKMAYEKKVTHFSVVNFDYVKSDWACVRMKANVGAGSFDVKVIVPVEQPRTRTTSNPGACASPDENFHALLRLPINSPIGVVLLSGTTVMANFVQYTGPAIPGSTTPTLPCLYTECNPIGRVIELSDGSPSVKPLMIVKEDAGTTPVSVPASGIPIAYNTTNGTVTLAWVYNFDFSNGFTKEYRLFRKNNGEVAFTQVLLPASFAMITDPKDALGEHTEPKDGFTSSEFRVDTYDNGVFIISSEITTVNWN